MIDLHERVQYMITMSAAFEKDMAKAWSRHAIRYLIREEMIRLKLAPALEDHVALATEEEWKKRGKAKLFPDEDEPDVEAVMEQAAEWEIEPFYTPELADWLRLFDINSWEPTPLTTMFASMAPTRLLAKHIDGDASMDRAEDIHIKAGLVPANILSSAALSTTLTRVAAKCPGGKVRDVVDLRPKKIDGICFIPRSGRDSGPVEEERPPVEVVDLLSCTSEEDESDHGERPSNSGTKREETKEKDSSRPPPIPGRSRVSKQGKVGVTQIPPTSKKIALLPGQLTLKFPPKDKFASQSIIRLIDPTTDKVYGTAQDDDSTQVTAPSLTSTQLLFLSQDTSDIYRVMRKVFEANPRPRPSRPIQNLLHDAVAPLLSSQYIPAEADASPYSIIHKVPNHAKSERIGERK